MPTQLQTDKSQGGKGKIVLLVVDHDAQLGESVLSMLNDSGYDTHFVRDGKHIVDVIKEIKPALLVLDMAWPNVDGYEVLEAKKSDQSIANIPTLAISTMPATFDAKRATALGVIDQVLKPSIDPKEVVTTINRHFNVTSEPAPGFAYSKININNSGTPTPKDTDQKKPSGAHEALKGKKILWVEDDKFLGNILKKRVSNTGCDMFLATNGNEALAQIAKETPNIVVLDLVLPGMSGFDILKKIRDDAKYKDVPILVLSNLGQSGDIERAKILGAEKFLVKAAVSLDEILRQIEELIK